MCMCRNPSAWTSLEGEAMLAAARKHNRVVQVGTQRKSTPHLIEAREAGRRGRPARQDRPRGNVLLLPHARQRQPARQQRRPISLDYEMWTGPAPCGRTTVCRTRAGGAPSWNTATASSATCASTCSTPCAGCCDLGWPKRVSFQRRHLRAKGRQVEHLRHADRHVRIRRLQRGLAHRTWGDAARPELSVGAVHSTARKARSRPASMSSDFHPAGPAGAAPQDVDLYELEAVPRGQDREGPGKHVRRRPFAGTCGISWLRSQRARPVADIGRGHIFLGLVHPRNSA